MMPASTATLLTGAVFMFVALVLAVAAGDRWPSWRRDVLIRLGWIAFAVSASLTVTSIWLAVAEI